LALLECGDAHVVHDHADTGRPLGFRRGRMTVRNRTFIWLRHSPDAALVDRIRYWGDHLFSALYYIGVFVSRPRQIHNLTYAFGLVAGVIEYGTAPPQYSEPPARREYRVDLKPWEKGPREEAPPVRRATLAVVPSLGSMASAPQGAPPGRRIANRDGGLDARLRSRVLLSALVCVVPPTLLLGLGRLVFAGRLFWLLLAAALLRLVILGRAGELLCVLVAVSPLMALLRQFAFYNVVIAVFGFGSSSQPIAPDCHRGHLPRMSLFVALAAAMSLYWMLSFVLTNSYISSFRVFELVLAVYVTLLISAKPAMLAAALRGFIPPPARPGSRWCRTSARWRPSVLA